MVASWAVKQSQQVFTAILSVETTTVNWSLGLRRLIIPGPEPVPLSGMPFDHARNQACLMFLQSGMRYLFFIDSDVVAPPDTILRLMVHNLPIVSGMYCRRSPPVSVPVMQRPLGHWLQTPPGSGLVEVDVVGAGCLLIRRDVIESLPPQRPKAGKHWFDWRVDCTGILPGGECLSEDFSFCVWARKHGIKTFVDTGILCSHQGHSDSRYGWFGPLNQLPAP